MESYPRAAVERAMKVQEVILRAIAKKITWFQAAEIAGLSARHMRRLRWRYENLGYDGLLDRRRGLPSERRAPLSVVEQVLRLYREQYYDLNVRHFNEKLAEQHGIQLSYTWVKSALQGAGLVAKARKRGVHRKRRVRRPLPGMLLHIDGSRHQWFQDDRWFDLIVILDDATRAHNKKTRSIEAASLRSRSSFLRSNSKRTDVASLESWWSLPPTDVSARQLL